jgi:hypothetical protein
VRVLAPGDAAVAEQAIDRPARERAFELCSRLAFAAPADREGDAAARTQPIDKGHAHPVRQPIAIVAVEDRQEHAAAAELLHRAGREVFVRDAGHFVDHNHQEDVVGVVDRAESLAHFDAFEPAAFLEARLDLRDQPVGRGLAHDVTDNGQDIRVWRGVIAVHAHFADDAR